LNQVRLKHVARINDKKLSEDTPHDQQLRYIDIEGVGQSGLTESPQPMTFGEAPSRARRLVSAGDTIVSTVRTYLRAVWAVQEPCGDLVVSTGFAVVSPGPLIDPRYLSWALQSNIFIDEVVARSVGVSYPAISPSDLGDILIPVPEIAEQRAIAGYLDRETVRIDQLIASKRYITDLIVTRFRTQARGSTTSGPVLPLRRVVRSVRTGTTPPTDSPQFYESPTVDWYTPGDFGAMLDLGRSERLVSDAAIKAGVVELIPADCTLVVGIGATAGRVAHLTRTASSNQQITSVVTNHRMLNRFLSWHLWSRTEELRGLAPHTTLPIISNDYLKSFMVNLPSAETQREVVFQLDRAAARLRDLLASLESQLVLLAERRMSVITSAVLGEKSPVVVAL